MRELKEEARGCPSCEEGLASFLSDHVRAQRTIPLTIPNMNEHKSQNDQYQHGCHSSLACENICSNIHRKIMLDNGNCKKGNLYATPHHHHEAVCLICL